VSHVQAGHPRCNHFSKAPQLRSRPAYRFHQWEANLRILGVTEIKTVPYVPWSHPFIERLIGTIRRECLDRLLLWTATDLELKLLSFRDYYNRYRTHSALEGQTPIKHPESKRAE
jgi:putative transposase